MVEDLKKAYRTIVREAFPEGMEISFVEGDKRQTLVYEKVTWEIAGERKGLRSGENPGQPAALYRPTNGNLVLGDVATIQPGPLPGLRCGDAPVRQAPREDEPDRRGQCAEHPAVLHRDTPCAVAIMKHNNPCGVALGRGPLAAAYLRADTCGPHGRLRRGASR